MAPLTAEDRKLIKNALRIKTRWTDNFSDLNYDWQPDTSESPRKIAREADISQRRTYRILQLRLKVFRRREVQTLSAAVLKRRNARKRLKKHMAQNKLSRKVFSGEKIFFYLGDVF